MTFRIAELLGEVVGPAEQRRRRRTAFQQVVEPREQHAVGEVEVDLVGRHIRLKRLDGGVVAAGLVADRDRHAREILRPLDRRIRRHEDAGRRHRIDLAVKPALALGGCDPDGPVAGAAHVGVAAGLERLHGADAVALVVVRAVRRLHLLAEHVVEPFVLEVALLLGDPLLQAEVRLDDELFLGHGLSPVCQRSAIAKRG